MCKSFHCLPYEGGILDQPGAAILRVEKCNEALLEFEEFERTKRDGQK